MIPKNERRRALEQGLAAQDGGQSPKPSIADARTSGKRAATCGLCGRPLDLPEVIRRGALVHFACGVSDPLAVELPTLAELQAAGLPHSEIVRRLKLNLAIRIMQESAGVERGAA